MAYRPHSVGADTSASGAEDVHLHTEPGDERGAAEGIELAVLAARRCFDDERSDWRRMTPSECGKLIHRIGDLIEEHADELALEEVNEAFDDILHARNKEPRVVLTV